MFDRRDMHTEETFTYKNLNHRLILNTIALENVSYINLFSLQLYYEVSQTICIATRITNCKASLDPERMRAYKHIFFFFKAIINK